MNKKLIYNIMLGADKEQNTFSKWNYNRFLLSMDKNASHMKFDSLFHKKVDKIEFSF